MRLITQIKTLAKYAIIFTLYFWSDFIAAQSKQLPPSLGGAAENALEPIGILTKTLYNFSLIFGICFILGSVVRFKEYRENDSQTPISRPIVMLVFGIVMVGIPLIAKLSDSATCIL